METIYDLYGEKCFKRDTREFKIINRENLIKRITERHLENGKINRPSFIYKMALQGKFLYCKKGDSEKAMEIAEFVDEIITIAKKVYPNNWSFYLSYEEGGFVLKFMIRFQNFEIRNSKGEKHNIRNLFVVLRVSVFYNGVNFNTQIYGFRSTISETEFINGYRHSHLQRESHYSAVPFKQNKFCLGNTNTPIYQLLLKNSLGKDLINIEFLFHVIQDYVKYESIEGNPHIYMNNLFKKPIVGKYDIKEVFNLVITEVINDLKNNLNINYKISNGRYEVFLDSTFRNYIKNLLISKHDFLVSPSHNSIKRVLINGLGHTISNYYNDDIIIETDDITTFPDNYIIFNGEKIKFEIIPDKDLHKEIEKPLITNYNPHPELINKIAAHINDFINEKILQKHFLKTKILV